VTQTAAIGLVAGLIGGGIVVGVDHATGSSSSTTSASSTTQTTPSVAAPIAAATPTSWVSVAAHAMPAIVEISTIENTTNSSGQAQQVAALGTGFVIDRSGDILTNQHVISAASSINVQFEDGTSVTGKVIGQDPSSDLAVVRVHAAAAELHPLTLGRAEDAQVGEPVLAIGTPFGFTESASAGIISGLGREIQSPNGFTLANALQTDAAVNHGNSGGPLLNTDGQVIGINAQIADSGVDANVGVAFAVPMDQSDRNIVNELVSKGSVSHPWLGIAGVSATPQLEQSGVTTVSSGVLVTAVVAGGPAATAGIIGGSKATPVYGTTVCGGGDVITRIGNTAIASMSDLQTLLENTSVGATLPATIIHANGSHATVSITFAKQPSSAPTISSNC
jgi:S1-C subfamily serine protease